MMLPDHIRNFCIIAHIDHGKSTLADRILDICRAVEVRQQKSQILDKMDLERERGITIKAQAVRLAYAAPGGEIYQINLIDTPGHVDFTYEVSRSLAACEGAMLVVDATQSVEAQTLANVYLALDHDLEVVPVINKIDLPSADPQRCRTDIEEIIGIDAKDALPCSAKTGLGVEAVLAAMVQRVPPPVGDPQAPLKALLFDSWFDPYQGVVVLCRILEGTLRAGEKISLMRTGRTFTVGQVGAFTPAPVALACLSAGEVGFVIAGIKDIAQAKIGDTLTHPERPCMAALPGFKQVTAQVFAGIFPIDSKDYQDLKDALEKLQLNDASFSFEPETSQALGFGYRCGFLGLLHLEIIQERLEREYKLQLITTAPTVIYQVTCHDGSVRRVDNPALLPPAGEIAHIDEPMLLAQIHVPKEFVGAVMKLCEARRGSQEDLRYLSHNRVVVAYRLPAAEVVYDFYDRLKSASRGFASCDYTPRPPERGDLVKLDILINNEVCDALSVIVHRQRAYDRGQGLCSKLKDIIPRQQFEVAIQAAIGGRIISRANVKAFRKNVTAKCYGGDISRKRKLLEKQKEGKKRMKSVGNVELPQEAFLAVLKAD